MLITKQEEKNTVANSLVNIKVHFQKRVIVKLELIFFNHTKNELHSEFINFNDSNPTSPDIYRVINGKIALNGKAVNQETITL